MSFQTWVVAGKYVEEYKVEALAITGFLLLTTEESIQAE